MNSASRGLWPVVGLRRPGKRSLRRRRPTPGAERLRRPISIGTKAFGWWVAYADREKILLRRRRPTSGAPAPGEADFNRRQRPSAGGSACTPN